MQRRYLFAPLVPRALVVSGCASDDEPADIESPDEAPFDPDVDSGVENETNEGDNLGFEADES